MASPLNVQTPRTAGRGLICLTLGLITLAVFAPALQHEFLAYDDGQYVTENPHVVGGLSWQGVNWAFRAFYASNWHPLTWLSHRSEEHTSELQSHSFISYAVFCLKK